MPPENSFTQLLQNHIRRSEERDEYLRTKVEELCVRQEAVENEVVGTPGDISKPSIRSAIQHLQNNIGALKKAEAERVEDSKELAAVVAEVAALKKAEAARLETRKLILGAVVTSAFGSAAALWALARTFLKAISS